MKMDVHIEAKRTVGWGLRGVKSPNKRPFWDNKMRILQKTWIL